MTSSESDSRLSHVHEAWLPREHALHRPRHGNKQVVALLCAALFFCAPLASYALGAKPQKIENRPLTDFPNPDQGWSFFTQLTSWATDHLVFRQEAIDAINWLSRTLFREPPQLDNGPTQNEPVAPPGSKPQGTVNYPKVIHGKQNWLYLGAEVSSHCAQAQPLSTTFRQLARLNQILRKSGRRLLVLIAPDKATLFPDHLPDNYIGERCHQAVKRKFWNKVASVPYIIDIRDELRTRSRELGHPLYAPKDAHWLDAGAIVAIRELAQRIRPSVTDTWETRPGPRWRVPADLPPMIGRSDYTEGRHYALMPNGSDDRTHSVPTNFRTPLHLNTASGEGTIKSDVAWLGDSFTIRSLRYLAAVFRDMTVLHHAAAQQNDGKMIARVIENNDIIVLEVAERSLVRGGMALLSTPVRKTIKDAVLN